MKSPGVCCMTPDRLLFELAEFFDYWKIRYAIVGSVASIAYGEPRMTNDVDFVVELKREHVTPLVAAFSAPDFYLSEPAIHSAIAKKFQFNIIDPAAGYKADIILSSDDDIHHSLLARRCRREIGEAAFAWLGSPEDIILGKLQYHKLGGSPKHIRDIAGILKISGAEIDRDYIAGWVDKLQLRTSWNEALAVVENSQE
ncbi:hypothetical protein [Anatilimnocola floriformis]|uniref:hypothetical protein n=1 Tax=Anatilimnocola floriformis TaxID=2948575 RepID=UPI0020C4BE18|nr:hypothetical protein [Anatilimnocola floriformis]